MKRESYSNGLSQRLFCQLDIRGCSTVGVCLAIRQRSADQEKGIISPTRLSTCQLMVVVYLMKIPSYMYRPAVESACSWPPAAQHRPLRMVVKWGRNFVFDLQMQIVRVAHNSGPFYEAEGIAISSGPGNPSFRLGRTLY